MAWRGVHASIGIVEDYKFWFARFGNFRREGGIEMSKFEYTTMVE